MFDQDLQPPPPNSRAARIRDAWGRASAVGLLGALSLLAGDSTHAETTLAASADSTEPDSLPPAAAKAAATVIAQSDPAPSDVAQGAPTRDGSPPQSESKTDAGVAAENTDSQSADAETGSSTSLQLIEATFASESLSELLIRINNETAPPIDPITAAAATETPQPVGEESGVTIRGTDAADVIVGTEGVDVLIGGAGDDDISGKGGNDTIRGGAGDDTLSGGAGDDKVSGNSGEDSLRGDAGDDTLDGGTGNDAVQGGAGDDVVIGGLGADWLSGGDGVDCFQFNSFDDSGATEDTRDRILDFRQGEDKIDFAKINADFEALGGQSLVFIGLDEFAPGHGQLRYQHLLGQIADDDRTFIELVHGDGHGHMQIELQGLFTMTLDDFLM